MDFYIVRILIMSFLEENTITSSLIHKGIFASIYKDKVLLPNNKTSYREYIAHPKAVLVVPVFENEDIILIKQYRYPLRQVFIEIPAGKVDEGEDVYSSALRELEEETGYHSKAMKKLTEFYPCVGYSTEEMHLFIARELSFRAAQKTDEDEFVKPFRVSLAKALLWIEEGKIKDMKTILSLYLVKNYLS